MTRLPMPGADANTWGNILNDFLRQEHTSSGSLKIRADGTLDVFYQKPATGIPPAHLDPAVRASLGKADSALQNAPVASVAGKTGDVLLIKGDITGLDQVDNTSDLNKPVSNAVQTALNAKVAKEPRDQGITKTPVNADVNAIIAPNAGTYLTIPTYVDNNDEVAHPSVVISPDGWNGYKYWMAITPYKDGNNVYENPSIFCSDDGNNWQVPDGLTNPIVPYPGGAYNSDPNLAFDADGTLHLVFRECANSGSTYDKLKLTSSTDGVHWTAPATIIDTSTFTSMLSPCLLYDGKQWLLFVVDISSAPGYMMRRTASSPRGPWSAPVQCSLTAPPNASLWHIDIKQWGQELHALVFCTASTDIGKNLYFAKSLDGGLTWSRAASPMLRGRAGYWDTALYKATMVPSVNAGRVGYDIWYGSSTSTGTGVNWLIGRTFAPLQQNTDKDLVNIIAAGFQLDPYVAGDLINRADSPTTPGTATSGQAFSVWGSAPGVINRQYYAAGSNSKAAIDVGLADGFFSIRLARAPLAGENAWFIFRGVDTFTYWRFGVDLRPAYQKVYIQKVNTQATTVAEEALTLPDGCVLEVSCAGSTIQCTARGTSFSYIISDSYVSTGTKIGFQSDNSAVRFDRLLARRLVNGN